MSGLASYMAQYDHEQSSSWNKLLHGIGIPLIFAGLISLNFAKWVLGGGLFAGGWMLLFLGHRIEGSRPAFFQGLAYLLVGPFWVGKKAWGFVTGAHSKILPEQKDSNRRKNRDLLATIEL